MEILLLGDNNLETVGGEQESTKIILNGIKDTYKIGVIQPGEILKPENNVTYFNLTDETRIKHLIKNPIKFIKYIVGIKKIISRNEPKVIHTQAQVSFFIVALLKKMNLVSKSIFLIHTERGLYSKYNKVFKYIFFYFMKDLNLLVTTTEFNMKSWKYALQKKYPELKYKIIENTAGKLFETVDYNRKKNNNKITVGFAGRYTDWKNWPLAVEIVEKLNDHLGSELEVKMAVGCLDDASLEKTQSMFDYLTSLLKNRFDGKININLEEMNNFYYDIDIFILTSDYNTESFGRTLVEAMSRLNTVLTTDSGGSVEVVGNPKNVYKTANQFVNRVIELSLDREMLEEDKLKNLNRVKNVYSLENNLTQHLRMYSEEINN